MRTNIHELVISGGNLRYIAPEALLSQFAENIRCLMVEKIDIMAWDPQTLVGLSSLEQLIFKYVNIHDIQRNALEAVDNTLETLRVTASGSWNPKNLTGSSNFVQLRTVDFSFNLFSRVIDRESFTTLKFCEVLFLNSCGITTIGAGTFDYLRNIKILHLNNNFLVTVPSGLFKSIALNVKLRVNLHNNSWLCDCTLPDLRLLSNNEMMLVDSNCFFPEHVRGKSLKEFYDKCENDSFTSNDEKYVNDFKYIYLNDSCTTDEYSRSFLRVISPINDFPCPKSRFRQMDLAKLKYSMEIIETKTCSNLLKPTFKNRTEEFSMIEISSTQPNRDFGILWYQSKCPDEFFCLNILPNLLRIYNTDVSSLYTFCPLRLNEGLIQFDECIRYGSLHKKHEDATWIALYILTAIATVIIGALWVYLIIRLFPSLLKRSNWSLFLKNKNLRALLLPPKLPLETKLDKQIIPEFNNAQVFVLAGK